MNLTKIKIFSSSGLLGNIIAFSMLLLFAFDIGLIKFKPISSFISKVTSFRIPIGYFIYLMLAFLTIILFIKQIRTRRLSNFEKFIISILNGRELGFSFLFKALMAKFKDESRIVSSCTKSVLQLERRGIVISEALVGGIGDVKDELFKLTTKGKKQYEKLGAVKDEAEAIFEMIRTARPEQVEKTMKLEPNDKFIFILEHLANREDRASSLRDIESDYFRKFKDKSLKNLQILLNDLEQEELVQEIPYGNYGEIGYSITSKGLMYLKS